MHWFKSLSVSYSKMHLCIKKPQHYVPNLQWCADVHQFPHRHRTLQPNVNINCEDIGLRLRRRQLSKQPIIELKPLEGDTASFNPSKQMPDNKDMLSVTLTPSAMLDTNAAELAIKPSNNQLRNLLGPKSNNVSEMHHSQAWKLKHDLFFHRTASKDYYSKTNLLQKPIINIKRQNHQFRNEVFVHNTDTATVQSCAGKTAAKKPDGDKCEADCSRNDAEDEIKSKALVCQAICKGLPVWEVLSSTCGVSQMPPPPNQSACSANTSKSETNNPPKCDARNQPSKPLCAPLKSKCGTQTESSSTEPYDARKKPETPLCQPSEPKCGTTESFADVKPATRMCELPKTQFGGKPECSTTKKGGVSQATVPTQSSTPPPCDTNCDADQTKTENRKKENSASNYPAFHPNSCGALPPRTKSRIPKHPSHSKCQKSGHIKEPESDIPSIAKFTTNSNKEPDQSGSVDACGNEHGYDIDGIPHPATMSLRTSQKSLLMCVQFKDRIDSTNGPQDLTAVLQNSVAKPNQDDGLNNRHLSSDNLKMSLLSRTRKPSTCYKSAENKPATDAVPLKKRIEDNFASPTDAVKLNWNKPSNRNQGIKTKQQNQIKPNKI